jgi:hypothetical protein
MKWIVYGVLICSVFDLATITYANSMSNDSLGNILVLPLLILIIAYTLLAVWLIKANNLMTRYKLFCVLLLAIPCLFLFAHALAIIANIVAFLMSFLPKTH